MAARATKSPDDWYRSDAWDEAARELFEAKLRRARSNQVQYLRIKGTALVETDDRKRVAAGQQLLQRVIEEHPDNAMQVAGAHHAIGDSLAREGLHAEAEQHLRACLDLEATGNF